MFNGLGGWVVKFMTSDKTCLTDMGVVCWLLTRLVLTDMGVVCWLLTSLVWLTWVWFIWLLTKLVSTDMGVVCWLLTRLVWPTLVWFVDFWQNLSWLTWVWFVDVWQDLSDWHGCGLLTSDKTCLDWHGCGLLTSDKTCLTDMGVVCWLLTTSLRPLTWVSALSLKSSRNLHNAEGFHRSVCYICLSFPLHISLVVRPHIDKKLLRVRIPLPFPTNRPIPKTSKI